MKPRLRLHPALPLTLLCAAAFALGGCASHDQKKYNEGYYQASGDSMKREFWLRQERERRRYTYDDEGRRGYYTFSGPSETADGVRLAPHPVTVPIDE